MTTKPSFHGRWALAAAFLIVLAFQVPYGVVRSSQLEDQGLRGPDSYMRLLRVVDLQQRGDWYDTKVRRTNAPYGETLHWGRPLDAVLLAGAWLASPFADDRGAVYVAGLLIGPLIAILLVPVWSWGTRPFLGGGDLVMICCLSGAMTVLALNTTIGRPDHHGFLALLLAVQLAASLRLAAGAGGKGTAILLGVAGGLAIWESVVALLAQLVVALVLADLFLRGRQKALRDICVYALALAATLTVALLLERTPSDLLTVAINRVSIVHWTLAAASAVCWWAIYRYFVRRGEAAGTRARLAALAVGGGIPLALIAILFPRFFLGPFSDFSPDVISPFLAATTEYQPLLPTGRESLLKFLIFLSPAVIGLGFIVYDRLRCPPERRPVDEVFLVALAVYVPAALWSGLLVIYAEVVGLVPWAMCVAGIMRWERTVGVMGRRMPLRAFVAAAAVAGPFALAVAVSALTAGSPSTARLCDWPGMGRFLRELHGTADRREILFSYLYHGPELAWRTPYDVVGAPYGNAASYRDTHALFSAETDAAAKRVVDERGIGLILTCAEETENRLYRRTPDTSFLSRIEAGNPPAWLTPVTLPDGLSGEFKLFRVFAR